MAAATENLDPNLSFAGSDAGGRGGGAPPAKNKKAGLRVSISPKKPDAYPVSPGGGGASSSSSRARGGRSRRRRSRRSSGSHFGDEKEKKKEKREALRDAEDDDDSDEDDDDEESDIEFTLDGAAAIDGAASTPTNAPAGRKAAKKAGAGGGARRRRRSSARFLRLSAGGNDAAAAAAATEGGASSPGGSAGDFASSEHLGEIYRQAIRMNAENKINAGNSWGLKLIENMDKFIVEDAGGDEADGDRGAREQLREARKMKSKDERGRVNFAKASCTLDASVKIYSYRVDDVHLSSYRVLANLNRTDNKKDDRAGVEEGWGAEEGGAGEGKAARRRAGPRGPTETLESNVANINMSKLDSAYDIDPLFHKMSKSFDEGGAKGLLLGNLGVSQHGCHIVFDSKDEGGAGGGAGKLDDIEEEAEEMDDKQGDDEENDFDIDPEEAMVWKESEIDITNLASKLSSMLSSYGHRSSSTVPFVPQLESLRQDYAALEEEGYAVDEHEAARAAGRRRLRLYDAPEEEEKEAEKSIHVIAMERSRGSVLGMSFDTNFRLSMGDLGDDDADGEFGGEDFGGEGEFAPAADDGGFGGDGGGFEPDFGGDGGFDDGDETRPSGGGGTFVDARSYNNTRVLLDALCSGDAFYEGGAGENGDYAFFDMKKFEKATDGNLWAGSQHWKKKPASARGKDKGVEKKRVMFDDDGEEEKKVKKRAAKKDRVFIDFMNAPDVDAIFEKKKTTKRAKKLKDSYQMPQTEKDFLLPPDANVDISQLTRLFSRPNAVVRRKSNGKNEKPVGKTVGFYDVEDNALGFDDEGDDGDFADNDDGGFTFAYGEDDGQGGLGGDVDNGVDYNLDNFDEVRKVEKINIAYATVAKKVDVRRLKKDLWAELEARTSRVEPETFLDENEDTAIDDDKKKQEEEEQKHVSFKETVEKIDMSQSQNDVTVSFYFICCLHLANEKGLKLDAMGLEDFMISVDDGSAPTFGTFGDGFTETANKLSSSVAASAVNSRGKRQTKVASYVGDDDEDEDDMGIEEE